ncbi:heavy-metal-associated domain-containing protein [Sphingorhabdus sp. EL138]|uniref:heavy-metal-associated domain-containing protein n=1 Tax=Sphingorhabdus sp. EL138 TaxID=2073156 RepID=UPI0025D88B97|nr:heavy-metal-associated domain-containing protein [Sphingorhabdus sp. EL138]
MSPKGAEMTNLRKNWFRISAIGLPLALVGGGIVVAQIDGPKRGIAPIASAGDFEVTGVSVNVVGDNAFEARKKGWEQAQRIAWAALWRKTHNEAGAGLSDSTLDGITAAIVVEQEQIGPRRYVAKLGVLFDRARAGQLLGVSSVARRSAPLMLLPVTYSAGAPTVFEQRTSWQRSWAKFRTADSTIDYVRPSGAGGESLLLNAGQAERRSRIWWRTILDQFGAADVIIPIARIERQWPGGPVIGRFSARYGPDNKFLGAFTLRTSNSAGIPAMMDQAVLRMDQLFQSALSSGRLRADASLVLEPDVVEGEDLESEVEDTAALNETGTPLQEPAAPSLDDVVKSIVPESQLPSAPQPRP